MVTKYPAKTVQEAIRNIVYEGSKWINDRELILDSNYLKGATVVTASGYHLVLRKDGFLFYLSVTSMYESPYLNLEIEEDKDQ